MQSHKNLRILVGEDEMEVRGYLDVALKCLGYQVELAQDGEEVLSCLHASSSEISAVLLDLAMPRRNGIEILGEIRRIAPDLPVIIVSAASSPLEVVAAMKNGASDFLCKPVSVEDLRKAIARALEVRAGDEVVPVRDTGPITGSFIGRNPRMMEIQALIGQIGWSEAPVLIQGETGSGKEVLARELHAQSPRSGKVLVKLNCAALPSELVESELFGYERGAFTGAFQKKAGMFELADGGTIFLDEIGDMDVRLQAKLLQVLQDQEFQRIGGKSTVKVDVRIMAATHRDLEKAIAAGTFREDLYYRLNVINLVLPPLRERPEDIVPLAEYILKKHTPSDAAPMHFTPKLIQAMNSYHWPGNVRELENLMRRLLILRNPEFVARELMAKTARTLRPAPVAAAASVAAAAAAAVVEAPDIDEEEDDAGTILEQVTKAKNRAETDAILNALNSTRWNRKQAAALLEIDYKALLYKMKKLGVEEQSARLSSHAAPKVAAAAGGIGI